MKDTDSHYRRASWLPIIVLGGWWAGFALFPTSPENVGIERISHQQKGEDYYPSVYERFVSASEAIRQLQQPHTRCADTPDTTLGALYIITCWRVESDVGIHGWGTPHWILEMRSYEPDTPTQPIFAGNLYRACAACVP